MTTTASQAIKPALPPYDQVIVDIKDYVFHYKIESQKAWSYARTAILDALGCAIESVSKSADCRSFLGPVVPGTNVPDGFRLPGTSYQLDPLKGAFDFGTMIRYLDHNDALAGADWGHPSGKIDSLLQRRSLQLFGPEYQQTTSELYSRSRTGYVAHLPAAGWLTLALQ